MRVLLLHSGSAGLAAASCQQCRRAPHPACPRLSPPAAADVTLGVTAPRLNPEHPEDLNGHHGVGLNEAQTVLVRR